MGWRITAFTALAARSAVVVSEHLETPLYAARPSVAAAQQRLLYLPPLSPPLLTSSFD